MKKRGDPGMPRSVGPRDDDVGKARAGPGSPHSVLCPRSPAIPRRPARVVWARGWVGGALQVQTADQTPGLCAAISNHRTARPELLQTHAISYSGQQMVATPN